MPKRNRNGQAATLTLLEVEKIYQSFSNERDRVIWMILSGTGERITAVLNLNVTDVYRSPSSSKIWDEITFPSSLHSPRRTLATRLSAEGVPISVIQKITGHRSIAVLQKYIEVSDAQVKSAMDML